MPSLTLNPEDLKPIADKIEKLSSAISSFKTPASTSIKLFTVREACKVLNISPRTCQSLRDEGRISFHKIGAKVLFSEQDILDFLAEHRISKENGERYHRNR